MRIKGLPRRTAANQSGATAIEYGLVAGLIALGILGALVGTRGSLNSTYSGIASGVGGGGPTVMVMPTSSIPFSSFWSNKTLVAGYPVKSGDSQNQKSSYLFTDGSSVDFTNRPGSSYGITYKDPKTFNRYVSQISNTGSYYAVYNYTDATFANVASSRTQANSTSSAGNPDTIQTMFVTTYNQNGSVASQGSVDSTPTDRQMSSYMYYYDKYFLSIQ